LEIPKNFSIFDKEDSLSVIKMAISDVGIDPRQFQPPKIQSIISRFKGDLITNEEFENTVGNEFFPKTLSLIWNKYEEHLKKQRALDFDDLVAKVVFLFQKDKKIKDYYQEFWQHILIDEYQDTNKSQYELTKILAEKHRNICAIGDLDQAIYGWRGADFRNILNFENDYPDHTIIVFEENYRSTSNILEAAAKVIEKNKMRKPKKLLATRKKGEEISIFEAADEEKEAEFVSHKIKELLKQGVKPTEITVLFRANFQSRVLEESCLSHKIPYQMLGLQFYERKEIKDIIAYLKASLNPDDLISIKRIINVPSRGISKVSILNYFANKKLPDEVQKKVSDFLKILRAIKKKIETEKVSNVIRFVIKETDYQKFLEGGSDDDKERLENLKELVTIAHRYDEFKPEQGIEKMLTDISLMSEQDSFDKKKDNVRLMTVHSAKGLEFEYVFIVGLEEGLFPHSRTDDGSEDKKEEERRLFYVALTRAKEKVFLSFSATRMIFGAKQLNLPSQFLSDIPEELLKLEEFTPEIEYEI
jgi:DNA helicase-2/ATP-dependent DNA helicase PcrA